MTECADCGFWTTGWGEHRRGTAHHLGTGHTVITMSEGATL